MPDDRKRTYQSVTSVPSLRTQIAVPPLQMVLVGDAQNAESDSGEVDSGKAGFGSGPDGQANKERVVRKIIDHLKKEI
jgi:hypothetical protein